MPNSANPVSPATASAAITHPARLFPQPPGPAALDYSTTGPPRSRPVPSRRSKPIPRQFQAPRAVLPVRAPPTPSGNARHPAEGATPMIHHSASSQPHLAGRGIPRIRRWATGLAVAAIASLAGAPAALAGPLPPPGGAVTDPVPPPPPPSPRRPPTSRCGPSSPSWPLRPSCPSPPPSSRCRWNTGTAPAAPRPRAGPRRRANPPSHGRTPGRAGRDPQQPPAPGRLRHAPGRQPVKDRRRCDSRPGVILNGCRTASPSATWRTDPHTRQFPGAAPPSVPHGHHPRPGSRRGDGAALRPG